MFEAKNRCIPGLHQAQVGRYHEELQNYRQELLIGQWGLLLVEQLRLQYAWDSFEE
jgi:hypothetical protein